MHQTRPTLVVLTLLLTCPILAAPRPKPATKAEAELEKMQGTWIYQSQTIGGRALGQEDIDPLWVKFDGDLMTKTPGHRYKLVLDPAANPKTIDLASHEHPSGNTFHQKGIYEWDGETLRMCFDNTGKDRPKEFGSPKGQENIYLSVLKRKKK